MSPKCVPDRKQQKHTLKCLVTFPLGTSPMLNCFLQWVYSSSCGLFRDGLFPSRDVCALFLLEVVYTYNLHVERTCPNMALPTVCVGCRDTCEVLMNSVILHLPAPLFHSDSRPRLFRFLGKLPAHPALAFKCNADSREPQKRTVWGVRFCLTPRKKCSIR